MNLRSKYRSPSPEIAKLEGPGIYTLVNDGLVSLVTAVEVESFINDITEKKSVSIGSKRKRGRPRKTHLSERVPSSKMSMLVTEMSEMYTHVKYVSLQTEPNNLKDKLKPRRLPEKNTPQNIDRTNEKHFLKKKDIPMRSDPNFSTPEVSPREERPIASSTQSQLSPKIETLSNVVKARLLMTNMIENKALKVLKKTRRVPEWVLHWKLQYLIYCLDPVIRRRLTQLSKITLSEFD